jgi:type II secretory pathway pseudopilin PulG
MRRPQNPADTQRVVCAIQRGFTYLTVLFILAMLGGGLALTGEIWHAAVQRDKEAELLYIGSEYRRAIGRYFLNRGQRIYPRNLDDLLKDPRDPATVRHLRKRYVDPITGKAEWGIVKAPDGGIMGVYSLSADKPLKVANFRVADKGFDASEKYSDWKFVYTPPQQPGTGKPAPKPPAGGAPATPTPAPATKP